MLEMGPIKQQENLDSSVLDINNFTNDESKTLLLEFVTQTVNSKHGSTEVKSYSVTHPIYIENKMGYVCSYVSNSASMFLVQFDGDIIAARNYSGSSARTMTSFSVIVIGY